MKKTSTSLFILLACIYSSQLVAQFSTLYAGMGHPESVISDGKYFYVTDIGKKLDPLAKDGDGSIWKFSLTGHLVKRNISKEQLNGPKGTAIIKNILYVADLDRIAGIDIATGEKVIDLDFSSFGANLMNDIAVKDDSTLFASSTDLNKVFQISLGKNQHIEALDIPAIKGANGICYDAKNSRLYFVGLGSFTSAKGEGEIGYIDFKQHSIQFFKLKGISGFFDGVALLDNNTLVITDWIDLAKTKGVVKKINLLTEEVTEITTELVGGPADFYFDKKANQLIIPATLQGRLLRLSLNSNTVIK
ncbi:MAG: hypothetical protein ABIN94_10250 [Ferruginibacter sp.]